MSSTRSLILLGVLVAAGALLYAGLERRDPAPQRLLTGGNFDLCSTREGDDARSCYTRETARELAAVSDATPDVTLAAPSGSGEVTFASLDTTTGSQPLLCDLHARVGVVDEQVPSWLGWTEPLAGASPVS
ncbi:MAG TPA: hypothetical protein VNS09_17585 [Solirubrobacter sp.]|nr:hypothetical protein [Solirubrobacter sp.]